MTRRDKLVSTLDLHLDELIATEDCTEPRPHQFDRRRKPRLKEPFPVSVSGVDSSNLPFNDACVLDNISSNGLYLRLPRSVAAGTELRLTVYFLNGPTTGATATLQGRILRSELHDDGRQGLAIAIEKHRFL